jgi:hypothetical protein
VTPASQGSGGRGTTRCGGPSDSAVGATHGGSDPAPEPDSATGAMIVGAPSMTEPTIGV